MECSSHDGQPPPAITPAIGNSDTSSAKSPVVSDEFAVLSAKFVDAINRNTQLEDQLHAVTLELSDARSKISHLSDDLRMASSARVTAETSQMQIEHDLIDLTESLFKEANEMVSEERKTFDTAKRQLEEKIQLLCRQHEESLTKLRNQSEIKERRLRSELDESRDMQRRHDLQLQNLKDVLTQLEEEIKNQRQAADLQRATFRHSRDGGAGGDVDCDCKSRSAGNPNNGSPPGPTVIPDHTPLAFSDVIQPVFRTDLDAFDELKELLLLGQVAIQQASLPDRLLQPVSSPENGDTPQTGPASALPADHSLSSPPGPPKSPTQPELYFPTPNPAAQVVRVKESRLYQRLLVEDLEPGLRLDRSSYLNFFSRRTLMGALVAGTLSIEPLSNPWVDQQYSANSSTGHPFIHPSQSKKSAFSAFGLSFGFKRRDPTIPSAVDALPPSVHETLQQNHRSSMQDVTLAFAKLLPGMGSQTSSPVASRPASAIVSKSLPSSGTGSPFSPNPSTVKSAAPASSSQASAHPSFSNARCFLCVRLATVDHPQQGAPTHSVRFIDTESGPGSAAFTADSKPLLVCDWCVGRLRACIEIIAFLRMVAAGIWSPHSSSNPPSQTVTPDSALSAWKELTRLRERLFWRRIGAGTRLLTSLCCSSHDTSCSAILNSPVHSDDVPDVAPSAASSHEDVPPESPSSPAIAAQPSSPIPHSAEPLSMLSEQTNVS